MFTGQKEFYNFLVHKIVGLFTVLTFWWRRGLCRWLGRWICNPEIPGSNPPPCRQMDLCLVVPDSTPPLANSHLVVGIFSTFLFILQYLFSHLDGPVSTAALNHFDT